MRIGLIAMSGVRAVDPELIRVGLTLPGFVERSKVIASLPSLGLLTLAALTPPEIEVSYHEVVDLNNCAFPPGHFDLVAISTFTAQSRQAYALADQFRANGTPVVMGGLHVSSLPEEALEHCDSVVVGEGEPLWPRLIEDWRCGRLQSRYQAGPGDQFDLTHAPLPRFELLDISRYNRITVQTSRGCPHRCEFCASSILIAPRYRTKPVERVMAEIDRIRELWPHPFIEFADDNSFVNRRHGRELLEALAGRGVRWFTEADISIAEDPELLELMRRSGCRQVLIGLESPGSTGLEGIELRGNWKRRQRPDYEQAIATIQSHGITVNGCFILGLDGDDVTVFDEVRHFIERTGLYETQLTVLTPFPGTPLYERLRKEGRLLAEGAWDRCTLFDVNFRPARMSPEELRTGLIGLMQEVYEPEAVRARRERFFRTAHRRSAA